ncbi:hypothetical protein BDZ97DRAFT_1344685 [Flammula alnicola]|nr:hypothetical protein BDZ97DRAFT_1344685 [Flammula alnicola]
MAKTSSTPCVSCRIGKESPPSTTASLKIWKRMRPSLFRRTPMFKATVPRAHRRFAFQKWSRIERYEILLLVCYIHRHFNALIWVFEFNRILRVRVNHKDPFPHVVSERPGLPALHRAHRQCQDIYTVSSSHSFDSCCNPKKNNSSGCQVIMKHYILRIV